jgi:gliding motility-associated-like protein
MYSSDGVPDTLINLSEIQCERPVDTIPPCAPILTVGNICEEGSQTSFSLEDLQNELEWTNPNSSCADDVVTYTVYYTETEGTAFEVLEIINDPNDTAYTHDNLLSLAGCYAITATDSFGNVSELSNIVCVDNCPFFELPNVFTPNGDGSNEFFTPFLPVRFVDRIDIKIFDRWGALVYQTTDPEIRWDGNHQNSGKKLAEGVYYYVCDVFEIRVDGILPLEKPLEGYIQLIR